MKKIVVSLKHSILVKKYNSKNQKKENAFFNIKLIVCIIQNHGSCFGFALYFLICVKCCC